MKFINIELCKIYENRSIKAFSRNSVIVNDLINNNVQIYNGKIFRKIAILDVHLNHKLGELSFTRVNCVHLHKKKKQVLKSKNLKKNVKI